MENYRNLYFSDGHHLEWRQELLDIILKGDHPGTIPAKKKCQESKVLEQIVKFLFATNNDLGLTKNI